MITNWFEFCKAMYRSGQDIGGYVATGAITKDQYKEITGKEYVESNQQ